MLGAGCRVPTEKCTPPRRLPGTVRMSLLETTLEAAAAAAAVICRVYAGEIIAERKGRRLAGDHGRPARGGRDPPRLEPTGLPVLAEESVAAGRIPELGELLFVVDPLDGTKEFLKRNGEFTVNIALVEDGRPVIGVVLVPVTGEVLLRWARRRVQATSV